MKELKMCELDSKEKQVDYHILCVIIFSMILFDVFVFHWSIWLYELFQE